MSLQRGYIFFFACLLAACSSYQPAQVTFARPAVEDPEVRISREFRREARKRLKLVQHPEVERYINQVGQRIVAAVGPQPFDYRFFVVENSQLNAFAVPGGSIYMHTGLIDRVSSTDEIAGVLAHEIAHVNGRHAVRMAGGPDPLTLLSLLGVFLGGSGPQAALTLGQALAVTRQLSYNRQLEQEADTLGVKYMAAAGFDPQAALSFLKTVDQERILNPIEIPPYLMTHPLSQERIVGVESAIRSLALKRPKSDAPDPLKKIQTLLRLERHEADAVVAQYEKALSQNPKSAEAAQLLGLAHYNGGRWAKAAEYLERARAADLKSPGIDRDLGRLYTQTGEFGLAREALERALAAEPGEPLNYLLVGELYEKESKLLEAAGAYLRANQLAPMWPVPARQLGIVYGKMNRLGDAYYYLGRSHLLADEDELAIGDLERALKHVAPTSPRGEVIREELETIKARKR
jgi:predicted Zn-dependent protease